MKTKSAFIALLSSLCLCVSVVQISPAADPELKKPYQLRVVLHFADHRLLTDVFQDRVERELRDGLQASFGDLARVEVVRDHPRLKEVLDNGLKALDGWKERSDYKTHFVLIDFAGANYDIQARQHDGVTGLAGPVVRRDRTRDREFVAKAAALMVEQDFGLIGSFDAWPATNKATPGEDQPVTVRLRGAGLDVPLDRWVHEGDVFAVVQMAGGDKAPGAEVKGALLLVDKPPAEGSPDACVCRVFRRYPDPPRGGAGGFRCVKLGTVRAPFRLKLQQAHADGSAGPLENALTVHLRHRGFDKDESGKLDKQIDNVRDSFDTTEDKDPGVFDNVAFVTIYTSDNLPRARLPIPLLDDQPVVIAVNVDAGAGSTFAFHKTAWENDVNDAWAVQAELFKEINDLTGKEGKRGDALKLIRDGLRRTQGDTTRLGGERADLEKEAKEAKGGPLNLDAADKRLAKVKQGEVELNTLLAQLEDIEKDKNDPIKKKQLEQVALGRRLEADLEIAKAIALYDQLLKDGFKDAGVEKHLADLRETWKPRSDKHKEARRFIYEDWPDLDDAGLKAKLPTAQEAFKTCKEAGDKITVQRMLNAAEAHAVRLSKELGELHEVNESDEKPIRLIKEVGEGLKQLAGDMVKFLGQDPPAGK